MVVIAVDSTCVSSLIEFSLLYKIYAVVLSILELYELKLNFTFNITHTKKKVHYVIIEIMQTHDTDYKEG